MAAFSIKKTDLEGAYLINCFSVGDKRGGFTKIFEKDIYRQSGLDFALNETFLSVSQKYVIRGLHFQTRTPQAKLVSVPKGRVYDVIVDLRRDSITYGQWRGYELSEENHMALYIPRGFAHGFLALDDENLMLYQCDGAYDRETDTGIRYDDPDIGIKWPVDDLNMTIHSERDLELMPFRDYEKIMWGGVLPK